LALFSCSSDEGSGNTGGSGGARAGSGGSSGGSGGSGGSSAGSGGSAAGAGGSSAGSGGAAGGAGGAMGGAGGATGGAGGAMGDAGGDMGGAGGAMGGAGGAMGDAGPGDAGNDTTMSFFVTSEGAGEGGNLGGLEGADAKCKALATAVSAALGAKDWKAYLSTSMVDARTRIGDGPWHNADGVLIASSVAQLHEEGGMMNAIRPDNNMPSRALDEKGEEVPMGGGNNGVHDILTGSTATGTRDPMNRHCDNWTSTMGQAVVGHHDRQGGAVTGDEQGAWNSVHAVGCGAVGGGGQTVASGGGRGSIYCFAAD